MSTFPMNKLKKSENGLSFSGIIFYVYSFKLFNKMKDNFEILQSYYVTIIKLF